MYQPVKVLVKALFDESPKSVKLLVYQPVKAV